MLTDALKTKYKWPAIGNDRAVEFLTRSLESGKISQTYVFIGPSDLGKSTIALAFARNLQGQSEGFNSDLYLLSAEDKKTIGIDEVRDFIKKLSLSSFLNSYKIGLIKDASRLSEEAKSALLKTLEEPQDKVVVILLIENESDLPATILSRSQKLFFSPVPAAVIYDYLVSEYKTNRSLAKDLASLAMGRPLKAIHYLENKEDYKKYLELSDSFLALFKADTNLRLKVLDKMFSDRTYSRQATSDAGEILDLAEGLIRDLLLLDLGEGALVQNAPVLEELKKTLIIFEGNSDEKARSLLSRLKLISQARDYLVANVNPRLVLEQLVINL